MAQVKRVKTNEPETDGVEANSLGGEGQRKRGCMDGFTACLSAVNVDSIRQATDTFCPDRNHAGAEGLFIFQLN